MDLVYVANSIIPSTTANSVHVMKMCQAFSNAGHNVKLIIPSVSKNMEDSENIYSYYGVEPNFDVVRAPFPNISKIGVLLFGLYIGFTAKRLNPDIVYGRSLVGCYFSSVTGQQVVYEKHTPKSPEGTAGSLHHQLLHSENLLYLVVISESLRRYYESNHLHLRNQIIVAHDGADPISSDNNSLETASDEDVLQVGYVGQLYEGKGMSLISDIVPECPFAQFHIIGGDREDVKIWKDELCEYGNIKFYGHLPHSEAVQYLPLFDVVLAPYQQNVKGAGGDVNLSRWMSPLKIFEYMSAGRPIICSDLPVLREVLTDGETAILLDPQSPRDWVNALRKLHENDRKRLQMGERAEDKFNSQHTWTQRAKRISGMVGEKL